MQDYLRRKDKEHVSESLAHEHDSDISEHRQMTGYKQHPNDSKLSELFNIHNSFDNISVGTDKKGTMTIAVSSEKELASPTLGSDRKLLKGSRRRKLYEHFGELYTNSASPGNSAFAYKARRVLSENRLMSEFKRAADSHLDHRQREMAPFLTLDEDRKELQKVRGRQKNDSETQSETGMLERSILRKTELENRFLRKLRIARRRAVPKPETEKNRSFLERLSDMLDDGAQDSTDDNAHNSAAGGTHGGDRDSEHNGAAGGTRDGIKSAIQNAMENGKPSDI